MSRLTKARVVLGAPNCFVPHKPGVGVGGGWMEGPSRMTDSVSHQVVEKAQLKEEKEMNSSFHTKFIK